MQSAYHTLRLNGMELNFARILCTFIVSFVINRKLLPKQIYPASNGTGGQSVCVRLELNVSKLFR